MNMKKIAVLFLVLVAATATVSAWTGPTQPPPPNVPDGNVSAPINAGTTNQVKNGGLSVNAITVFGNSALTGNTLFSQGSTRYLNFGVDLTDLTTITGSSGSVGYGIRDNAGVIEFKNSGGVWENRNTLTGNFTVSGNITAAGYFHNSDERLKDGIVTSEGLGIISKLRGVSYVWKKDGTPSAGVIAQDVEKVLPNAVRTDAVTGFKSVEYNQLIAPLIEAIKEQQVEISSLRHEIEVLKAAQ